MIYLYRCVQCGKEYDIIKSYKLAAREEICPDCSLVMQRVWTVPEIGKVYIEPWYSPAHGKMMKRASDLKDANKEYHDKTGSEMIEVGNEKVKHEPKRQEYTLPREVMAKLEAA